MRKNLVRKPINADQDEGITRDQHRTLSEQVLILQKTLDRQYDLLSEMLEEQNTKINETRERVGKLELLFSEVVETFKDVGAKFNRQTKEIQSAVEDSVVKEIQPVHEEVQKITTQKPKIIHVTQSGGLLRFLPFLRRRGE